MNTRFKWKLSLVLLALFTQASCGKVTATSTSNATTDGSTSGTVASTVGGAINGASGGTFAMLSPEPKSTECLASVLDFLLPLHSASASTSCPTLQSGGAYCAVSGTTATLTYSDCTFGTAKAQWTGSEVIAFVGATPACGHAFPTTMSSVSRTFGANTTRTSGKGIVTHMDTLGVHVAVDGNTYSGGSVMNFASGVKSSLDIPGINIWNTNSDHSITTNASAGGATIVLSSGTTVSSGKVVSFHNKGAVKAISTFTNVVFSANCCTPTAGTISTSFSEITGVTPTKLGLKLNGTTETLTFSGCGQAMYKGLDGTTGPVMLGQCF